MVQFEEVEIVAAVEHYGVRVVLEAMHIMRLSNAGNHLIHNPNLDGRDGHRINKSDGLRLSPLWGPVANKLRRCGDLFIPGVCWNLRVPYTHS